MKLSNTFSMSLIAFSVSGILLVGAPALQADISPWISYQGVLRDAAGDAVPDGSYSIEFNIFDVELGGPSLWTETQTVTTSGGVFDVFLGANVLLSTLAWDVPYWLGIRIEGEPWLVPRTPFTTVPYAAHAGFADTVLEGDQDWTIDGDDVYHETGYVGIGLATGAGCPLDVLAGSTRAARFQNDAQGPNFAVSARNEYGAAGGFFGGAGSDTFPYPYAALYARGEADHRGLHVQSEDRYAIYAHSNTNRALHATTNGTNCAYFGGGLVEIAGRLKTGEFYMNPGTIGHVLTSDAYGVGTWQPPAAGGDSDWTIDGNNVYHETGYVGIGIGFSERPLDVVGDTGPCARFRNVASGDDFAVDARNDGGTAGAFFAGPSGVVYPAVPAALYGNGAAGYRGAHLYSEDDYALFALSGSNRAIYASTSGGYCAYFAGGEVEVDERLKVGEFEMSPGTAGYVLTSDASGVGTWQPASSTADGDWTIAGNDMYSGVSGRVGAGANAPTAKFHVYTGADEQGLRVVHDIGASGQTASIERAQIPNAGNDILQLKVPTGSGSGFQFIECENGSTVAFAVNGDGAVTSQGGGSFSSDYLDENVPVLGGVFSGSGSADVAGVYGESTPGPGFGIGGEFVGGRWGVKAIALAEGTGEHYGLYAAAHGVPGANFGVVGYVESGISRYGVYGGCVGSGYAGFFAGDVHASGTLTAGTKSFKIDHPLDPENKYLMHSSVESDEMMNIYNGNVALDAGGEAWVEMPDWFEVLNEDFRYQLTAIGAPGPNLHIAERIADGRFKIAGGEAGMDVSWMVTGVRHDPVAAASPLSVEVDKPSHEAGKYLNPEAYDKPASLGVGHIATPDAAEKRVSRPSDTGDANDGE